MDIQDIQFCILGFADFGTLINALYVSKFMRKISEKLIIDILTEKICLDVKEKYIYKREHSPSPSLNNNIKVEIISAMSEELNKILPANFVPVPCAFTEDLETTWDILCICAVIYKKNNLIPLEKVCCFESMMLLLKHVSRFNIEVRKSFSATGITRKIYYTVIGSINNFLLAEYEDHYHYRGYA